MEDRNKEISIDNEFGVANGWKPYDFMMFIERELTLRGISHQIHDLPADLGSIKVCLTYIKGCGRMPSSFVKYCLWLFDGLTKDPITSLAFMPASLRHFYGNKQESKAAKKLIERHVKKLDTASRGWLDQIKQQY